jgi:hypothetical protein
MHLGDYWRYECSKIISLLLFLAHEGVLPLTATTMQLYNVLCVFESFSWSSTRGLQCTAHSLTASVLIVTFRNSSPGP